MCTMILWDQNLSVAFVQTVRELAFTFMHDTLRLGRIVLSILANFL